MRLLGWTKRCGDNSSKKALIILGLAFVISIILYLLEIIFPMLTTNNPPFEVMLEAAKIMAQAINTISNCRITKGLNFNPDDVNKTGLIGLGYSPITTTVGDLEAKRTTTNPNFAGLLVLLLWEVGVRPGDAIAIGASGSFPALIVATLSAAKAMGVEPLLICSLAASQWGANDPDFTWLEIEKCLVQSGVLPYEALAVSLGGDKDLALDLDPAVRELLRVRIKESGKNFIFVSDLSLNVAQRIALYEKAAGSKRIAAFVNIGGAYANVGTTAAVLYLKPGINKNVVQPPHDQRGVLFVFAEKNIPVLHLLNIKELVSKYELPWDPRPLPSPGEGRIYYSKNISLFFKGLVGFGIFCIVILLLVNRNKIYSNII